MQRTPELRELMELFREKLIDGESEKIEVRMPHSNPELELFSVWLGLWVGEDTSSLHGTYIVRSNKIDCRCGCEDKVCYRVKGRADHSFCFKTAPKKCITKFQLDENGNRVGEGKPVISEVSEARMDPEEICEKMEDLVENIEAEVNGLIMDKQSGVFINPKDEEAMDDDKMTFLTAKAFAHAKYNPYGEPCCVCNCVTKTKTRCGHRLCMLCWNSLARPACPMCRADVDEYGSSDDED